MPPPTQTPLGPPDVKLLAKSCSGPGFVVFAEDHAISLQAVRHRLIRNSSIETRFYDLKKCARPAHSSRCVKTKRCRLAGKFRAQERLYSTSHARFAFVFA